MLAWNNRLYASHYFKSNQDKHNYITTIYYFSSIDITYIQTNRSRSILCCGI